jgi:hypothetical protein
LRFLLTLRNRLTKAFRDAKGGLSHQGKDRVLGMLGRDPQKTAHMIYQDLFQEVRAVQKKVITDPGSQEGLLYPGQCPDFPEEFHKSAHRGKPRTDLWKEA